MTEAMNFLGLLGVVLGMIGTASAIITRWNNVKREANVDRRKAGSQAIDDLDQVRKALMEEIGRLSARVDQVKQENERLQAEVTALRATNERLTKRVKELETELKRLSHLQGNV